MIAALQMASRNSKLLLTLNLLASSPDCENHLPYQCKHFFVNSADSHLGTGAIADAEKRLFYKIDYVKRSHGFLASRTKTHIELP
jgi:hypothetical protein